MEELSLKVVELLGVFYHGFQCPYKFWVGALSNDDDDSNNNKNNSSNDNNDEVY